MTDENRALLAHLFRRAGFGATKADLDTYTSRGYNAAVEDLLAAQPASTSTALVTSLLMKTNLAGAVKLATNKLLPLLAQADISDIQAAWTQQMVTAKSVLHERMTLFLSNHFATAYSPEIFIDLVAITNQHDTIRKHAMGSFKDLAHAMIDDLALAVYLDNHRNLKSLPNENLARELMELFLLGAGNYTEVDVKEAARALTGYELRRTLLGNSLVYVPTKHDNGPKTILGTTAAFTPHSLIDFLLARPVARRFIATKLVTHFVSPQPDAALVTSVAGSLAANWNLPAALRVIFTSSQFKAPAARLALLKTPAEYVASAMRALGRTEFKDGASYMTAAGQSLYRPPTVAGWPQGQSLLGAGSMLARYNAMSRLAAFHRARPSAKAPSGPDLLTWIEGFGMTGLSPNTTDSLQKYAAATATQAIDIRTAGFITLLASSPEFNLA